MACGQTVQTYLAALELPLSRVETVPAQALDGTGQRLTASICVSEVEGRVDLAVCAMTNDRDQLDSALIDVARDRR